MAARMSVVSRRCANHPETSAVEICTRCGSFICGACLEYTKSEPPVALCTACARREASLRGPGRSRVALGLAIAGCVTLCFPLGVVAFALAQVELRALARGEVSERVRGTARAARVVGLVAVALFLVAVGLGVAFFMGRPVQPAP
jgi:hypothetical protein